MIILCFLTACITVFLDMTFQEGMLFHGYYKLIERLPVPLFKVLGGCIYCFGTWIFLILSICLIDKFSGLVFFGIGLNYVFIKAFERYVV